MNRTDLEKQMELEARTVSKHWITIVLFILAIVAYVWSSATRFQEIESRTLSNESNIKDYKLDTKEALNRINDKLDILIRKSK